MSNDLDFLINNIKNYVVAPAAAFGLGGYVFDVATESQGRLSADITDHYTENNKAIQDHIAIRPKKITLKGYVGELVFFDDDSSDGVLEKAVQKLTTLNSYLPKMSAAVEQIQASIPKPSATKITLADASNIYGMVRNVVGEFGEGGKQQQAYSYFKALMEQGVLLSVQTPWEFMTNMVVESIVAVQSDSTVYVSDFAVTLKQIRIVKTETLAYAKTSVPNSANPSGNPNSQRQGNAAIQGAAQIDLGIVPLAPLPAPKFPKIDFSNLPRINIPASN